MEGWIKLHRKLMENAIFKDSETLHLWVYLLLRASHRETSFLMNASIVTLKRGQLVFGIRSCSRDTGITPKRIRTRIALMEKHGFLAYQRAHPYSTITILNYDSYQGVGDESGHIKRHTEGTSRALYNNKKNVKEIYSQATQEIYSAYPRKADKNNSLRSIQKLLTAGESKEVLLRAVENYKASIQSRGTESNFIIQSNNFFGLAERYKEFLVQPEKESKLSPIELAMQRCEERGDI